MSGKKPGGSKSKVAPAARTETGRVLVLFESLQSQLQGLAEGFVGLGHRMTRLEERVPPHLDVRLSSLEGAVRQNGSDIRDLKAAVEGNTADIRDLKAAVEGNTAAIRDLKVAVSRVDQKLDSKADKREVEALGVRVAALEQG